MTQLIRANSKLITFGFIFPDFETFKLKAEPYDIDTTDSVAESMYKKLFNRYRNRPFKYQNGGQIMARVEGLWNDNLYIYKRLVIIRELDNDELEQGETSTSSTDGVSKAYNNTGSVNPDGTEKEFLQGTGKANTTETMKTIRNRKMELYNNLINMPSVHTKLFREFARLFMPFIFHENIGGYTNE